MPNYQDRMINYYPSVVSAITEFKAIIDSEYPEFDELDKSRQQVLDDAYLTTMGESRVTQWEQILGITPLPDSSLQDRRDTIIARIRGQGKLNTETINAIVHTFTGGTAISWVENSCLYVEITPPPNNKSYKFANVEQELKKKIPAHLGFNVYRNYYDWQDVKDNQILWQNVYDLGVWENVYLLTPSTNRGVI
jgi:hypothetical protein